MASTPFERRADEWAKRTIPLHLFEKPSKLWLVDRGMEDHYLQGSERCFGEMMRNCLLNKLLDELSWPFEQMQSPIERILALALTIVGSSDASVVFRVDGRFYGLANVHRTRTHRIIIEPQAEINGHHVDFVVTLEIIQPDIKGTLRKPSARSVTQSIVIECDGHEFHERTKEQARRDKRRDRDIQESGYPVFRFTGSEVYSDPFACAKQVIRRVESAVWRSGPQHGVSVEALKTEIQVFLAANGGLDDTWFYLRDEIVQRHGDDIWDGFQLAIASEGPFYGIMNLQGGWGDEPEQVQENFHDLLRSLGWWYEADTHVEWLFYPIEMLD